MIVLVAGARSYRTADFAEAARLLRRPVSLATDAASPAVDVGRILEVDFADPRRAAERIAEAFPGAAAVVAVDDDGLLAATEAARLLGLPHNPVGAVGATRNKASLRRLLADAGVDQPRYRPAAAGDVPVVAGEVGYPAVVKPVGLSASRGVLRVDDAAGALRAERRIRRILDAAGCGPDEPLLVEEYVEGAEVAVEGLLRDGDLEVLAFIDKPDPMPGPAFAETLFVTPSRLDPETQASVVALVRQAVAALGLEVGPIHAEVRIEPDGRPRLIEVAARTIGGLCGRALTFGLIGESLEAIVLRSSLGLPTVDTSPALPASGVLMLPVPVAGRLTSVEGIEAAVAVPGITDVAITISPGSRVEPLPEGDRYLGFVFAAGEHPDAVEVALRRAGRLLRLTIDGEDHGPLL